MVDLYVENNVLEAVIPLGRQPGADACMSANRVLNLLKDKLSKHYGIERIKVVEIKQ
jgi:hypothetical protein